MLLSDPAVILALFLPGGDRRDAAYVSGVRGVLGSGVTSKLCCLLMSKLSVYARAAQLVPDNSIKLRPNRGKLVNKLRINR